MMIKVPLEKNMDAIVKAIDMYEYAVEMQHRIRAEKEKSDPVISQYLSIIRDGKVNHHLIHKEILNLKERVKQLIQTEIDDNISVSQRAIKYSAINYSSLAYILNQTATQYMDGLNSYIEHLDQIDLDSIHMVDDFNTIEMKLSVGIMKSIIFIYKDINKKYPKKLYYKLCNIILDTVNAIEEDLQFILQEDTITLEMEDDKEEDS